ncbi:MAG: hypothetical protein ACLFUB_11375 [Cyclobacteriaceae bacterium]
MKFLTSAVIAAFILGLASSCSTYKSCPAYAEQQPASLDIEAKAVTPV